MLCSWILVPSRTSMGKFPFLECIFEGNQIFFILNGYRKRAVCRKHKVESGNWSFDPSGALLQPAFQHSDFLAAFIPIYKYPNI